MHLVRFSNQQVIDPVEHSLILCDREGQWGKDDGGKLSVNNHNAGFFRRHILRTHSFDATSIFSATLSMIFFPLTSPLSRSAISSTFGCFWVRASVFFVSSSNSRTLFSPNPLWDHDPSHAYVVLIPGNTFGRHGRRRGSSHAQRTDDGTCEV